MDLESKKYKIIESLMKVSDEDTLYKIEDILNNGILNEDNIVLTKEQKNILDKRLEAHKANPNEGRTWDEIKNDLSKKYAS